MYSQFPFWANHLVAAQEIWRQIVKPSDQVIDATCGNGNDTKILAGLVPEGKVWAFDIQESAVKSTLTALREAGLCDRVEIHHLSHATFPAGLFPESTKLIVYNLGYLPGGDKTITTETNITLQSIKNGMQLLVPGGMISITLYPGHAEGEKEAVALLSFAETLPPFLWMVNHIQWNNRNNAPSLLLLTKSLRM